MVDMELYQQRSGGFLVAGIHPVDFPVYGDTYELVERAGWCLSIPNYNTVGKWKIKFKKPTHLEGDYPPIEFEE